MTDWQPRLLRPGEEPALLQLLIDAFGAWPTVEISVEPIEHLLWKLEAGLDGIRAAVVEHEGSLVAALIFGFRKFSLKGRPILARTGWDVVVAPAYQGQGILSAAAPYFNSLNATKVNVMYGYRTGHAAARKAFAPVKLDIFGNFANVLVASTKSLPSASTRDEPWRLRVVAEFDQRFDDLWRVAAQQFDFIPARTRDFLDWRYNDRRAGTFTCVAAEQDAQVLGYMVERTSNGKGYLADLFARPDRLDVVSALARTALDDLRRTGVDEVECLLPSRHVYFDALVALGFTRLKTTKDFTYGPLKTPEAQLRILRDPSTSVHLMYGDTDLI